MMRLWVLSLLFSVVVSCHDGQQEHEPEAILPEAPSEVTPQTIDVALVPPACVPSSLNTVDAESGGNWVIKRAFWEAGLSAYDKIVQLNDQLFSIQMTYVNKRNEANNFVDTHFIELGFDRGELAQLLITLSEDIERRKTLQHEYTAEDAENVKKIEAQQKKLAFLKKQMEYIDRLDDSLDQVMSQVVASIAACRTFEKKAWENYKTIGKELNDKRAKDLYYQIESYHQSILKQLDYLKNGLANYFSAHIQKVSDSINELRTEINALQSLGTDLKAHYEVQFKKHEQQMQDDKDTLEQQLAAERKKEAQLEKAAALATRPWYVKMWASVTSVVYSMQRSVERGIRWMLNVFKR